jgi:thiol-disulfide isomerase/thioredoxin
MNLNFVNKRRFAALLALAFLGPVLAQGSVTAAKPAPVIVPQIEGKTIDGTAFNLSTLKGKVVLVMFWSTGCAVCRDKMPELRSNYAGWAGKPFELVAVSTDGRAQDVLDYERIISRTVPMKQRFVQLWTGESGYKDNLGKHSMLPAGYLLDKTGKVVERYVGRIPPEAWDRIADLL